MAKKVKAAITVASLKKDHGDRAPRLYQQIAIVGGHGYSSHHPPLDPNGYDEKTKAAVDKILADEKKSK